MALQQKVIGGPTS